MSLSDKLIINAAITGGVFTKKDSSLLPVSIDEITDCARQVQDAGAAIVHLHARNPDQSPSCDTGVYQDLINSVRSACGDLILCASLNGRFVSDVNKRSAALTARPDMASLTLGSANFATQPNINSPDTIQELASRIYASGAIPELEVFDTGFINYAHYLINKGILHPPNYFNIILGSLGSAPLDLLTLGHMVKLLPKGAIWAVGGLGRYQLDANVLSIAAGGHVRVGLEDNLFFDRQRTDFADNVRLVERIACIARQLGREPATPAETRRLLGMGNRQ
jgi:3-keto-5-aminohexanoate cleavage enzyme